MKSRLLQTVSSAVNAARLKSIVSAFGMPAVLICVFTNSGTAVQSAPVVKIVAITQNGNDLQLDGAAASVGVVNIAVRALDADSGISGNPLVTVAMGGHASEAATFSGVSGEIYSYTYVIAAGTAQGIATVDAIATTNGGPQAATQDRFSVAIAEAISTELIAQDGDCTNPSISGTRLVFEKRPTPNDAVNVYLYDLITKTTRVLAASPYDQLHPRIWQNWVVWQEDGLTGTDIKLCNIKTNSVSTLTNNGDCTFPNIADGLVSWCRPFDVGTYQIIVVPLATPSPAFTLFGPPVSSSPYYALSLDTLFLVTENYDLSYLPRVLPVSLVERRGLTPPGSQKSQKHPSTDSSSVVWAETGSDPIDTSIWVRNLRNGLERQVTSGLADRKHPQVAGDIVTWLEKRNGAWEIWASRLSNDNAFPLAVGQAERDNLDADGPRIVWQRNFDNRHAIMLATLGGNPVALANIGEGRLFQDNSLITATRQVITAVFPDRMYVQDTRRSGGMAIVGSWALRPGQLVDITGKLTTDGAERVVTRAEIRPLNELGDTRPLTVRCKDIGGGAISPFSPAIGAVAGLPNTGMFIKTTGKILTIDGEGFFITDNSIPSGLFPRGIRVIGNHAYTKSVGAWVTVAGISTAASVDGQTYPAVRELPGVSLAQYQTLFEDMPTNLIILDGFIHENRIWMITFGGRLSFSDDWLQTPPVQKYIFPEGSSPLAGLFVTSQGTIFVSSKGNGLVYRSTDNGDSFAPVFTMPINGYADSYRNGHFTNWGFDEGPDGTLYMGQYHFRLVTTNSAHLYWSPDNGTTWNPFSAWNSEMATKRRHIHQVKVDRFGSGRVWWSCGDGKRETYYSDDKGETYHLMLPHLLGGQTAFTWVGQSRLWGDDFPRWDADLPNTIKTTSDDNNFQIVYSPQSVYNVPIYDMAATEDGMEVWAVGYEGGPDMSDRRGCLLCSTNRGQSFFVFSETQDSRTLGIDFDYSRIFRGRHGIIPATCPYIFVVPTQNEVQKRIIRIRRITAP